MVFKDIVYVVDDGDGDDEDDDDVDDDDDAEKDESKYNRILLSFVHLGGSDYKATMHPRTCQAGAVVIGFPTIPRKMKPSWLLYSAVISRQSF